MKIITLIISIWIWIILLSIVCCSNTLYCYFFCHKEWTFWKKVIKNFDKKIFCCKFSDGTILYEITIDGIRYKMYYWYDKSISLHGDNLYCYDKYHQKKVRELFEKELSK
jgi:hypothetical protein